MIRLGLFIRIVGFCFLLALNGCRQKKSVVSHSKHKKKQTVEKNVVVNRKSVAPPGNADSKNASEILKQRLGVSETEISRSKLFIFINQWYGVPYKYGGCQKTGIDCSCFTNLLYEDVYKIKTARSATDMYNVSEKIELGELKEGDLIFFKINSNLVSHVGVYLRKNCFVHASTSRGVVISSMDEAYYKKYFHSGGRIKNS
jgi:lipoprotein Spr